LSLHEPQALGRDLLGALCVRRLVLVVIELIVLGSRGGVVKRGPDEVHRGSAECVVGDSKEEVASPETHTGAPTASPPQMA
jgi:hypothetical protein